ncbi:hypothetical protein [Curtobacterium oceanosedimentum]|uniref:hypothetical protein n=1 Tax=Curtobacterium oceanosedimentum TaxID=465820 RepID=UPI000A486957|nr:hypothetical protein [Curtobacterium oceanosedimentum]
MLTAKDHYDDAEQRAARRLAAEQRAAGPADARVPAAERAADVRFPAAGPATPGYQQQPYAGAGVPAWQPPAPEKKGKNVALRILIPVVAALAAVGASLGVRAFLNATAEPSPSALATEAAKQVNENYTFPLELDEVTRWDGVTADGAQLDYAYTIDSSIDPASLTAADLKSSVVSNVCQKKESRDLLSKAIVMRYSYVFDGTDRTIDFAVTNADC